MHSAGMKIVDKVSWPVADLPSRLATDSSPFFGKALRSSRSSSFFRFARLLKPRSKLHPRRLGNAFRQRPTNGTAMPAPLPVHMISWPSKNPFPSLTTQTNRTPNRRKNAEPRTAGRSTHYIALQYQKIDSLLCRNRIRL